MEKAVAIIVWFAQPELCVFVLEVLNWKAVDLSTVFSSSS